MNKDYIKEKWLDLKPKAVILGCLLGAFISGFTAANFSGVKLNQRQLNYTTNNVNKPPTNTSNKNSKITGAAPAKQGSGCEVKGNIATSGKKTYHVKGGSFYDRTTPEMCFNTEDDALAAGFVKSAY